MSYTNVFSNNELPPSDVGLAIYTITADSLFTWPSYAESGLLTLASIVELKGSVSATLGLPPASQVSVGESVLFFNVGSGTYDLLDFSGASVLTLAPGTAYLTYVQDNTSDVGVWEFIAYGSGTSEATAGTLAGSGLKAIGNKLAASVGAIVLNSNFSLVDANRASMLLFTGGATALSLPLISTLSTDFFCHIKNNGTGTLTITPYVGQTIDGAASLTVQPAESCILLNDGATAWVTVGLGRSTLYQYSNLTLDVSAGGTFTLTSAQAANKLLTFTGNPAAGVTVVVPAIVSIYYVANNLSTPYAVQIKTAGDAGTSVDQSQRAVILCEGASVTSAQTAPTTSVQSLLDGTVTAPSLNLASKTNTGLYKYSTQGIGLTVNGVAQLTTNGSGVTFPQGIESPLFLNTPSSTRNYNVTQPYGALQVGGADVLRFGSDNSGQLAGFRNILINGNMRIKQRNMSIAAAAIGAYGPDRWKKVDASNMTQIVEAGNYKPNSTYTLSGTGVTTQQLTSPASGNWTLPNIPITATNIQLEEGSIATPFEQRPIGLELSLCQRYYYRIVSNEATARVGLAQMYSNTTGIFTMPHPVKMRVIPTVIANGLYMTTASGNNVVMNTFSSSSSSDILAATIVAAAASFVGGDACLVTFTAADTSFISASAEL